VSYQAKTDKIYMILQRGDSVLAQGKHPNLRLWDGMVGYLDPQEWDSGVTFSDHWLGETCVVELPRTWKTLLLDATKPYTSILGNIDSPVINDTTRRTRGYVDIAALAPMIPGISDFSTKYYQRKAKLSVIDGSALPQSILLDTKGVDFTKRPLRADVGVITSGSYTVGPGGGDDYPRFGGVGGAWAALGGLTGSLGFTNTGAIIENAAAIGTVNLNGFLLDNTSDTPHNGDPTGGHLISVNFDNHCFRPEFQGPGTFRMHDLSIRRTANTTANYSQIIVLNVVTAYDGYFYDLLLDGNGKLSRGITLADSTPLAYVYNNVIWDMNLSGIATNPGNGNNVYENNTVYSCAGNGYDPFAGGAGTWDSNAGYDNGNDFANTAAATGRNNLDTDGTAADGNWNVGANNQINKTAANNVRSTDDTSSLFLKVKTGDVAHNGGAAVGIGENTTGIRGNARPTGAVYSIGADQIGSITVSAPDGGEDWRAGSSQNITWSSANIDGNVQIQLARNGVDYSDLFASTDNDGTEAWTVTGPGSSSALIKIIAVNDTGISDVSGAAFNILPDIVSINPSEGYASDNTSVVISGFGLSDATFTVDGVAGTVDSQNATTINGSTPALAPGGALGAKDVVVTSGGQIDTLVGGFTYLADPAGGGSGLGMSFGGMGMGL
jgi:hypothetical protein